MPLLTAHSIRILNRCPGDDEPEGSVHLHVDEFPSPNPDLSEDGFTEQAPIIIISFFEDRVKMVGGMQSELEVGSYQVPARLYGVDKALKIGSFG